MLTTPNKDLIRPIFVTQLRSVTLARLKLDGDLSVVEEIGSFENNAETALANLLPYSVVYTHHIAARGGRGGHPRSHGRNLC